MVGRRIPHYWLSVGICTAGLSLLIVFGFLYWRMTQREPIHSIAVLPLMNTTHDPNTDYLSDGISGEIINALSAATPQLRVIARTSTWSLKGKDPREARKTLAAAGSDVEAVLTGKLTRHADDLMIQVDLIQVPDGLQLWGEQHTLSLSELPAIQSEIASEVVSKLRLKPADAGEKRLKVYTENGEAYELYLKAAYASFGPERVNYLQQSIAKDPNFALAYVRLAELYVVMAESRKWPTQEVLPKAREAASRARALDDTLGEAHIEWARVSMLNWDWSEAERELKRGMELNANIGHIFYSWYLVYMGRGQEALKQAQQAEVVDPLSLELKGRIAMVDYETRHYSRAIEKAQAPEADGLAKAFGAFSLAETGHYAESIALLKGNLDRLFGAGDQGHLAYAYARAGKRAEAERICRELQHQAETEKIGAYEVAFIEAVLGRKEEAFHWLDIAYQQHDPGLRFLKVDPCLDSLRVDDSRFSHLVRRVGLVP